MFDERERLDHLSLLVDQLLVAAREHAWNRALETDVGGQSRTIDEGKSTSSRSPSRRVHRLPHTS